MTHAPFNPIFLTDLNLPWEKVLHLGVPVTFSPKQIIPLSPEDSVEGFYYIRQGRIRLSYIASSGQEKVLLYIGSGTLFNEIPSMLETPTNIFTCMEPTAAVYFPKKLATSADFARQYPELMLNWVESLSIKASCFFSQLCNSGLFDSFGNVCRLLYSMSLHSKDPTCVVPQLSQQELSSLLGIHRGSLHKALTRLKKEGIIQDYSRKQMRILDLERLESYADF